MIAQANKHRQKKSKIYINILRFVKVKQYCHCFFWEFFWWGQLPIMILDEKALELNRLHKERKNYIEMANTTSYKIQI